MAKKLTYEELAQKIRELEKEAAYRKASKERVEQLNLLREDLLKSASLDEKLKLITDGVVEIFNAYFCRIWLTKPGDLCGSGCIHAELKKGPHVCIHRDHCLHLMVSSGRYTHIDGELHRRVPFGCYKIGRIAAAEGPKFLTADVTNDPRIHDHEWAKKLGLVSFAGYRLLSNTGNPLGVLALFSKQIINSEEDVHLEGLANSAAQVIQSVLAEEALRESDEKYRNLVERANDGVIIAQDGIVKFVNNQLAKMLGYNVDEMIDTPFIDYVLPDERSKIMDIYKRRLQGEDVPEIYEMLGLHKDGRSIDIETNSGSITYHRKPATISFIRDITERKKAEKELLFKEDIIRSSSSVITTCDLEGNMTFGNPAFLKKWGFEDAKEFLGKPFSEYWVVKDRLDEIMQALQEGEGRWFGEVKAKRKDGTLFDVQISADSL